MKHTHQAREIAVLSQEAVGVERELMQMNRVRDLNEEDADEYRIKQRQDYLLGLYQSIGMKVVEVRRMKQAEKFDKMYMKDIEKFK